MKCSKGIVAAIWLLWLPNTTAADLAPSPLYGEEVRQQMSKQLKILKQAQSVPPNCDKAKVAALLHWSANDETVPLENEVIEYFAYIENRWPKSNLGRCNIPVTGHGRKCIIASAREARDNGFHEKAFHLAIASQKHNSNAWRWISVCSVDEVSRLIGGT